MSERRISEESSYPKGTLFVTGGSSGIGQSIIERVGQRYTSVFNFDFQEQQGFDVRNPDMLNSQMVAALQKGQVQNDLVVCAGVIIVKPFLEQTTEEIQFQMRTNLEGAILTVHSFLRWHKDNDHPIPPNIVIISSVSAHLHEDPSVAVYEASKSGLSHFVPSLASRSEGKFAINAIEPGTIRGTKIGGLTPDLDYDNKARQAIEEAQAREVAMLPVEITKEDIARICEKLLFENLNGDTNGKLIPVDGGYSTLKR